MGRKIMLTANTAGVDASWWTKGMAVSESTEYQTDPGKVYAIGDGALDLSFLTLPGLFLAAGPKNSRPEVIEWLTRDVSKDHPGAAREWFKDLPDKSRRFLSRYSTTDGFFDIEQKVMTKILLSGEGRKHQDFTGFIDRDGVICAKREYSRGREFARHIKNMGIERPLLRILTGSSMAQNVGAPFMTLHGLNSGNLGRNHRIVADPYIMLCENGAIAISVLDHRDWRNVTEEIDPDVTATLTGPFREELYALMDQHVLPSLGLIWLPETIEEGYLRQGEIPNGIWKCTDKLTMTTVNVPEGIRGDPRGETYRSAVLDCMVEAAKKVGLEYVR
jgi:hypothetical protein